MPGERYDLILGPTEADANALRTMMSNRPPARKVFKQHVRNHKVGQVSQTIMLVHNILFIITTN